MSRLFSRRQSLQEEPAPMPPAAEEPPTVVTETTAPADPHTNCPQCLGTGRVLRARDYLDMSLALFPTDQPAQMDAFVAEFYRRFVKGDEGKADADKVVSLFPTDLTTGDALNSKGHRQRDMLLAAIVTLIDTYDPDNPESTEMNQLRVKLAQWGRSHFFTRPDGSVRPATRSEFQDVYVTLVGLLHDVFGDKWRPEFDRWWTEAYDFAEIEMRRAARDEILSNPDKFRMRMPRASR